MPSRVFRYVAYDFEAATRTLRCRYALDDVAFEEQVAFESVVAGGDVDAFARLVFLLAGVSYYKAGAPPVVEVGSHGLTAAERALLHAFYVDGLGEFAFRNGLKLGQVEIVADDRPDPADESIPSPSRARALVPFGGGIDSIVTVEGVRDGYDDVALFVVSGPGGRFDAIEQSAEVTALPVLRATRRLDAKILRSRELGYLNGHVPVTGILSAIAVTAAALDGRDAVVMSNERSASSGNVEWDGREVNHQWSKSAAFEELFRAAVPGGVHYFSWLRERSELWVAERFAAMPRYHRVFRSCNRAFHVDPAQRLDHWCGECDKCCFIDLILAPFMPAAALREIFDGREPLENPELIDRFRTLVGAAGTTKPFECVGDVDECRLAADLAARRPDRAGSATLQSLAHASRDLLV